MTSYEKSLNILIKKENVLIIRVDKLSTCQLKGKAPIDDYSKQSLLNGSSIRKSHFILGNVIGLIWSDVFSLQKTRVPMCRELRISFQIWVIQIYIVEAIA